MFVPKVIYLYKWKKKQSERDSSDEGRDYMNAQRNGNSRRKLSIGDDGLKFSRCDSATLTNSQRPLPVEDETEHRTIDDCVREVMAIFESVPSNDKREVAEKVAKGTGG